MRRALLQKTQRDIAKAAHASTNTVHALETDDKDEYSIETGTLRRIAAALKCDLVIELRPKNTEAK